LDEAQQTHLYLEKLRHEEGEDEVDKGRKSRKAGLCVGELMEPRVDVSQLMAGRLGVLVSHPATSFSRRYMLYTSHRGEKTWMSWISVQLLKNRGDCITNRR
jgi:hypothetical protein